jgi:hypothetical protein
MRKKGNKSQKVKREGIQSDDYNSRKNFFFFGFFSKESTRYIQAANAEE